VIQNNGDETLRLKNENKKLAKGTKAHEKEIYNLENKNENQGQTIKNLKESLNGLKADKKKLEKRIDRKAKKIKATDSHSNCLDTETPAKPLKPNRNILISPKTSISQCSTTKTSTSRTRSSSTPLTNTSSTTRIWPAQPMQAFPAPTYKHVLLLPDKPPQQKDHIPNKHL
jgi:peptidoglycan hydrolase CwlO-like protein